MSEEITATERFEIIAKLYQERYGDLAPGKDAPMLAPNELDDSENHERFAKWWDDGTAFHDAITELCRLARQVTNE